MTNITVYTYREQAWMETQKCTLVFPMEIKGMEEGVGERDRLIFLKVQVPSPVLWRNN